MGLRGSSVPLRQWSILRAGFDVWMSQDDQPEAWRVNWILSDRADPAALEVADRHYNRQKPGTPQFVPPGRCVVLRCEGAVWVTSWPFPEYVRHAWPGAWVNSCFRNERPDLYRSSDLIREAIAATQAVWPEAPDFGLITFIDPRKVRKKRDFGRCYLRAGFEHVGLTKGGLIALMMRPSAMPEPELPLGMQAELWA